MANDDEDETEQVLEQLSQEEGLRDNEMQEEHNSVTEGLKTIAQAGSSAQGVDPNYEDSSGSEEEEE